MTFGEKLKQLRSNAGMTQEELACKLFVTRTAVSKWETSRGLPSIDSLKLISELFHVSIDELVFDGDVSLARSLDEKRARKTYIAAMIAFILCTLLCLLSYLLKQPYIIIGGAALAILYIVLALLSKPKYRRENMKKNFASYIASRVIILLFAIGLMVSTLVLLLKP